MGSSHSTIPATDAEVNQSLKSLPFSKNSQPVPEPAIVPPSGLSSDAQESIIQPGVKLGTTPIPLDGKLLPEERIASGQHSDLHKGVWAISDNHYKPVALKCVRLVTLVENRVITLDRMDKVLKRIIRETTLWKDLKHANILPFYGYQISGEELILVSMWSEKRSLDVFLAFYPQLSKIDKLELLLEAARGLEYLHSLQPPIAHGGIKPENVIITDNLHAALCDVGQSRVITNLGVRSGLTTGGQGVEFVAYQARELYADDSRPTAMSDVYAFGGLILTTMSGKGPFWRRKTNAAVFLAIYSNVRPSPNDHPELLEKDPLWETMEGCWNHWPENRPVMTNVIEKASSTGDTPARRQIHKQMQAFKPDIRTGLMKRLFPARNDFSPTTQSGESLFQPGAPVRDLLPHIKLAGTLAKIEKIGSGGYGDVFQGVWKRSDDEVVLVAIKSIKGNIPFEKSGQPNPEELDFMKRIIRETTIWKGAQHPNILPFHGYQIVGGEAMLVSPWCKNGSLNLYIAKNEKLRETDKLQLLCDAARGLNYLHSLKPPIAHGDIKPENVIITDELTAALCDFGISRVMGNFTTGVTTRNPGAGTTRYQAKELLLDPLPPTNMSDVYAYGGLILATMSGKPPFYQQHKSASIIIAISQDQTPAPSDHLELDEKDPLWKLLMRCWAPEPYNRPSASQVIKLLEAEIRDRSGVGPDPRSS